LHELFLRRERRDLVGLPAELAVHEVAFGQVRVVGFDHLGHAATMDHVTDSQHRLRGFAAPFGHHVHAHDRGHVEIVGSQQHLAGTRRRDGRFPVTEMMACQVSGGAFGHGPLAVDSVVHGDSARVIGFKFGLRSSS
jgi:hypothetical protein